MPKRKLGPSHSHRTGLPKSRSPVKSTVENYLRMANAGRTKRKPSMPKMPWEGSKQ